MLVSLMEKYSKIIESKETNVITWSQKNQMWEQIGKEFNSEAQTYRTVKNLKDKYENLKKEKKMLSQMKGKKFIWPEEDAIRAKYHLYISGLHLLWERQEQDCVTMWIPIKVCNTCNLLNFSYLMYLTKFSYLR